MKPETKYAFFILALSIIWKMLLLLTGWHIMAIGNYPLIPVFGFMLIGMYRGMEERRKMDFQEFFHFPSLFKSGMSIVALFAVTYSLFLYVYLRYLDSGFTGRMKDERMLEASKNNASTEDLAKLSESLDRLPNVTIWILFTFVGLMVLGAFYSGIITRMMRKKHVFPASNNR